MDKGTMCATAGLIGTAVENLRYGRLKICGTGFGFGNGPGYGTKEEEKIGFSAPPMANQPGHGVKDSGKKYWRPRSKDEQRKSDES